MNGKRSTLIAVLFVLLMAGQTAFAYADDFIPHLEVIVTNTTFAAGTHGNIGITIYNGGNFDATQIEAFITSAVPGISILNGTQRVVNRLNSDKSTFYHATIMVDQNVAVGAYTLTMQLTYLRALYGIVSVAIPITIVVNEQFLPMIELTATPKKLVAGGSNDVMVSVNNIASTDVTNLALSLSTPSPFLSIESPSNLNVTLLKSGAKTSFIVHVYALESTLIGSYLLTATTSYSGTTGDNHRQTSTLPLEVTTPVITKVPVLTVTNLNTTTAVPGQRFTIHARVDCNDGSVYNTKATLTLDAAGMLKPLSPTTLSLGDMKPGDSKDVSCTVLVDGAAAATQISTGFALSYTDSKAIQRSTTEVLTVQIGQVVDFEIMNPTQVTADQGGTAKIDSTLILKGTSKVQFTSIDVEGNTTVTVIPESNYYVGAIYPDSPVLFTIKFNVPSNAPLGDTMVKIRVSYLDNLNRPKQQILSYPVTITKPVATIGTDFWGWLRHLVGLG
jgi:uncharacterized membrane protein